MRTKAQRAQDRRKWAQLRGYWNIRHASPRDLIRMENLIEDENAFQLQEWEAESEHYWEDAGPETRKLIRTSEDWGVEVGQQHVDGTYHVKWHETFGRCFTCGEINLIGEGDMEVCTTPDCLQRFE